MERKKLLLAPLTVILVCVQMFRLNSESLSCNARILVVFITHHSDKFTRPVIEFIRRVNHSVK